MKKVVESRQPMSLISCFKATFMPVRTGCSEESYKLFAPDQGLWEGSLPSAGICYLRITNARLALWRKRGPHKT